MAIHFDFTVSDADAENIMDCINNCIVNNNRVILKLTVAGDHELVAAYKRDNEYLKKLKLKMKNTRVKGKKWK